MSTTTCCSQCKVERADEDFVGKNDRILKSCIKCRERGLRCRNKNKEYYTEYNKKWKAENKDRVKEYNKSYKTGDDWQEIKAVKGITDEKPLPRRKEHLFIDGVEYKSCSKCKEDKMLSEYTNYTKSWDGLRTTCNACLQEYRDGNKEKMTEYNKKYWKETKEEQTKTHKEWKKNNKEHVNAYMRKYKSEWDKKQRETNPVFKITKNLRNRLWHAIKDQNVEKTQHTLDLIGCSPDFLKNYLEEKFQEGMTWDNYGPEWHIDHIRPCSSFDLSTPEEQQKCFHYTNLQPLWAAENISKGGKWTEVTVIYELNFVD